MSALEAHTIWTLVEWRICSENCAETEIFFYKEKHSNSKMLEGEQEFNNRDVIEDYFYIYAMYLQDVGDHDFLPVHFHYYL